MRPLLIFLFISFSITISAQDTTYEIKVIKPKFADPTPEYPGGEMALMKFIQKNLTYPDLERESNIQGRVVIKFIVNEDGSLGDIFVAKGVSPGIDKEALRVIKLIKLKPLKQQGEAVRVRYTIPIMFKLASPDPPDKK